MNFDVGISDNPLILVATLVLLLLAGVALTFWGRRIVEAIAFVIFGAIGGILGLMIATFLISFFNISGILYWVVLIGLCLLGIIIGAWLSKSFLRGIVVFYCAIYAFFLTWVLLGGGWDLVPLLIAVVVAIVVAIVVNFLFEKLLAAITAFLGASFIGYAAYISAIILARHYFDKHIANNLIFLGIVVAGIIILGVAGTAMQLSGPSKGSGGSKGAGQGSRPPRQQRPSQQRRRPRS